MILDKWPVHVHPDVLPIPRLHALTPEAGPCASGCPGGACAAHDLLGVCPSRQWASPPSGRAVRRAGEVRRPIQRMPAPMDASWRHLVASSWGGGCGRRSPACTAGRQIAISCVAARMPSSRHVQPARQSSYRMSVSDSGLFIQRPLARRLARYKKVRTFVKGPTLPYIRLHIMQCGCMIRMLAHQEQRPVMK